MKLTKCVESITPDIAFQILQEAPETFEDTVRIAKDIEVALNSKCARQVNNLTDKSENSLYKALIKISKDQKSEIKEMKEQINNLKINEHATPQLKVETNNITEVYCHICKKSNHETQNYFYNQKSAKSFQPRGLQNNTRPRFPRNNYHQNNTYRNFWRNPPQYTLSFQTPRMYNYVRPYYNAEPQITYTQNSMPNCGTNYQYPQLMTNQMEQFNPNIQNSIPTQNFDNPQGINSQMGYTGVS